ncbi:MAG: ubiquinone biosynthesis protein UbiA, partial [Bacteroidota bacterium]
MKRSTWLHLRIPFSFFLLPVFLFAVSILDQLDWWLAVIVGVILHIFLYPASNGYNSYFDKDEQSIGGLKNPPKVSKELYWISLLFDGIALAVGLWISWQFAVMLLVYGLVSKAYSHPSIRLKKMPIIGWITAGFFQGYFTFLMVIVGVAGNCTSAVSNSGREKP